MPELKPCRICLKPSSIQDSYELTSSVNEHIKRMLQKNFPDFKLHLVVNAIICEICLTNLIEVQKFRKQLEDSDNTLLVLMRSKAVTSSTITLSLDGSDLVLGNVTNGSEDDSDCCEFDHYDDEAIENLLKETENELESYKDSEDEEQCSDKLTELVDDLELEEICKKPVYYHFDDCKICKQFVDSDLVSQVNSFQETGSLRDANNLNYKSFLSKNKKQCAFCGRKFPTVEALSDHKKVLHALSTEYLCQDCGKSFRSKLSLLGHSKVHLSEFKFRCNICNNRFNTESCVIRHIKLTHLNGFFGKKQSENDEETLIKLNDTPKRRKKFKLEEGNALPKKQECNICGKKFKLLRTLTMHLKLHDDGGELDQESDKSFKCEQCSKAFSTSRSLKSHVTHMHRKRKTKVTCEVCRSTFEDEVGLEEHKTACLDLICATCNVQFVNREDFDNHMGLVHSRNVCAFCDSVFDTVQSLMDHQLLEHQEIGEESAKVLYECAFCKSEFESVEEFDVHECPNAGFGLGEQIEMV